MTVERTGLGLPNFLFLGPDKSGSSWLQRELSRHEDVFLPVAKDTYFFNKEFDRGILWYAQFFKGSGDHSVVGEICHDYLGSAEAPGRIRATLGPDVRLMVSLREPLDRAFSDYLNQTRNGWNTGTFAEALHAQPHLLAGGLYSLALRRYLELFDRANLHVSLFDDLRADPQSYLDGVTQWLGVSRRLLDADGSAAGRPAAAPRIPWAARTTKWAAEQVRNRGGATLVGRVKSSRAVQRLLYRDFGDDRPRPTHEEAEWVRDRARNDVHALSDLLDIDLVSKWGYA